MNKKIMLVDDDLDLVALIKIVFQKAGYDVLTAHEGQSALRLLKTEVPDLMIFDLTMPIMNGWQLSMKVRQDPRFKKTPIIVLSGLLADDAQPEEHEAATAYVVKPFDTDVLLEKVKSLIEKSST